jgi:3-hydroxyisobutyrate dehydrogenase-like beta-hydroxyacid dehydrogenase
MSPSTSVSILGLGIIGAEWAKNLAADGVTLKTWNRTAKPEAPGFTADAADAARGAELIIIVVSDPAAVTAVLDQIIPVLVPGQIVAQASTVSAAWNLTYAARVEATGARFLEIPFTGSKPAAIDRKTVFYVGGTAELVARAEPLLSRISQARIHIGPLGSAASLKLAMNMNIAMVSQALAESLRFARAAGIPDAVYFEALKLNAARSPMSDLKEPKLRAGDYAPQFSLKHMHKDLGLAFESMEGLDLPQIRALKVRYDEGMAQGLGDEDFSVLMKLL